MITELMRLFADNEPELVLQSYEDSQAIFRLLDCDGYRLGTMVCKEVQSLCVTTRWERYRVIGVFSVADAPEEFRWLASAAPSDVMIVRLEPLDDSLDESQLPRIGEKRCGYITCETVLYQEELDPGR
jgi:hypothetical protein